MTRLVVGLDPGKVTGLCVLSVEGDGTWKLLERRDLTGDLDTLHVDVTLAVAEWMDWCLTGADDVWLAVERPFMAQGADTLDCAMRFGVVKLLALQHRHPFRFWAPSTIRRVIVGSGRAKDADVNATIRQLLNIPRNPGRGKGLGPHQPAAIAAALTCAVEELGASLDQSQPTDKDTP